MVKTLFRLFITIFIQVGVKILFFLIKILPVKLLYHFGDFLSYLYYLFAKRNRDLALGNLKLALGDSTVLSTRKMIIRKSCKATGRAILDSLRYKDLSPDKLRRLISVEGQEHLEAALKKGKGVIGVSAHLGSFTVLGYWLLLAGYKTNFIARHMRYKNLEDVFNNVCDAVGPKIIFNRPLFSCMRQCMKVLSQNEILVIELDQNFGSDGIVVDFFGRPAQVPTGPVVLSRHTQAVILPMFVISKPDHTHVIKIEPPVQLDFTKDTDENRRHNLQKIVDVVERFIRKYPSQWLNWIHKQWDLTVTSKKAEKQ